jgi:hypothetical protein
VSMPNHVPIALDDLRRVWRLYETLQHTCIRATVLA